MKNLIVKNLNDAAKILGEYPLPDALRISDILVINDKDYVVIMILKDVCYVKEKTRHD